MVDPRAMQQELDVLRRKVDVDNYTITIRELMSMAENNELQRAPIYQRKFRWDEEAESRLIESLLLGLPVPNLFFATNTDGTWEVVDGLQRISTLIHFSLDDEVQLKEIGKSAPLHLTGLRKLTTFEGLSYLELPGPVKLAFTKRGLGVTALSDKSDPETRFDTFERLNRGAVALSQQEVRACIYQGPLNDLLRELSEHAPYRGLLKLQSKDQDNATYEELVLKFFAYRYGRDDFKGSVKTFLNQWMEDNQKTADIEKLRKDFYATIDAVEKAVDKKKFIRSNTNVTPQNELEAVMVAASEVLEQHGSIGVPPAGWLDDPELVKASTGATNTNPKLRGRINRAKTLLMP